MRLYLDTADVKEWDRLMPTGMFYGITTNPLLAQRAGYKYREIDWPALAQYAAKLGARELHGQIVGSEDEALAFAKTLYQAGEKVGIETVVKIPLTDFGIRMTPRIKQLGGKVLMTACYNAEQLIIAQTLGAEYIAPYFGRIGESGRDAVAIMQQMADIMPLGLCRPLVASLRNSAQLGELAQMGFDCFTIAPAIADGLIHDPLSDQAAQDFERAAQ